MFGAVHNREITSSPPDGGFEYGNVVSGRFTSIMGYEVLGAPWVNYFSSPLLSVGGVATGAADTDVRRAHLERAGAMAAQGDERSRCPGPGGCFNSGWIIFCILNGWWCCWMGACLGLCHLHCNWCPT